jgi:hypothetical protein
MTGQMDELQRWKRASAFTAQRQRLDDFMDHHFGSDHILKAEISDGTMRVTCCTCNALVELPLEAKDG